MGNSGNYYRRRVAEELAAAERSVDPSIAQIHRELARRYRDKVDGEFPLDTEAAAGQPEASLNAAAL